MSLEVLFKRVKYFEIKKSEHNFMEYNSFFDQNPHITEVLFGTNTPLYPSRKTIVGRFQREDLWDKKKEQVFGRTYFTQNKLIRRQNKSLEDLFFKKPTSLKKELEWSLLILKYNIKTINTFLKLEREVFKHIFLGQYEDALLVLDRINKEVSYSLWSILLEMTICHLKGDREAVLNLSNIILKKNGDAEQLIKNTVFLHFEKLNTIVESKVDFDLMLEKMNDTLKDFKYRVMQQCNRNEYDKEYYVYVDIPEKYAVSPFNKRSEEDFLKIFLHNAFNYSIIDGFKVFSMVTIEVQTSKFTNLLSGEGVEKAIHELFPENALIKFPENYKLKLLTNKLFTIYEHFLSGNFKKVIKICIEHLKLYPYSVDHIYYLVNSLSYEKKDIKPYLNEFREDSLLYKILMYYYNIINSIEVEHSLAKLQKILSVFGIQTQWSMFLYYLLFDFFCLHRDEIRKSYSMATYYSYGLQPRFFYNLSDIQKQEFLNTLELSGFAHTHSVFNLYNDNRYLPDVLPSYRAEYIATEHKDKTQNFKALEKLYYNKDVVLVSKIKITINYVNLLFETGNFELGLKVLVRTTLENSLPLCMFNYEIIMSEMKEELFHMPEYTYLLIHSDSRRTLWINYFLKRYMSSVDSRYSLPSRFLENITSDSENIEIIVFIMKFIVDEVNLEEFVQYLGNSGDMLREKIKILEWLRDVSPGKEKEEFEELIKKSTMSLNYIRKENFQHKNKMFVDLKVIKKNLLYKVSYLNYEHLKSDPNIQHLKVKISSHTYLQKAESIEELLVIDFNKALNELIYSDYGLANEMEASIKHGFFDQRLIEPLREEYLIAIKKSLGYEKIDKWSLDDRLQKRLFLFTDNVLSLLKIFKEEKLSLNKDTTKSIFNFSGKNMIDKTDLAQLQYYFETCTDNDEYIDYLVGFAKGNIDKHLDKYRIEIKKRLLLEYSTLVKKTLKGIKGLNLQGVNIDLLETAFQNVNPKIVAAVDDVTSWFELRSGNYAESTTLEEIFNIKPIISLKINYKFTDREDLEIRPFALRQMYLIIYNIFKNVETYSLDKQILITLNKKIDDDGKEYEEISFANKRKEKRLGSGQGTGFIKKNLDSINKSDKLSPTIGVCDDDDYYQVVIRLVGEVYLDD